MKKLLILGMLILVVAVVPEDTSAIEYNTDRSSELTLEVGDCFYMDVWLDNVPTPLVTAGFFIDHDPFLANIFDVAVYDGELTPGIWDPGFTAKIPDAGGPGTYMLAVGQFSTVSPDDVRIARAEICAIAEGINFITITTIPDFQTVVSGVPDYEVYDPQIIPHTVTVNQIIPPCRCGISGPGIVNADAFSLVTAQYDISSNIQHCDNPPNYVWYDDCVFGDIDQSGLLYVIPTITSEVCSICVMDTANTDINTGDPLECCLPIEIQSHT